VNTDYEVLPYMFMLMYFLYSCSCTIYNETLDHATDRVMKSDGHGSFTHIAKRMVN